MMIVRTVIVFVYRLLRTTARHSISIRLLTLAVLALSTLSCEDVIEIDLNAVEPRIVIEGVVSDWPRSISVTISKTGEYFKPNAFPRVSGAIVEVSDDAGNFALLTEVEPGLYETDSIRARPGRTYTLNVEVDGETYAASSTMPERMRIYGMSSRSMGQVADEDGKMVTNYEIKVSFDDPPGIDNLGRMVYVRNGVTIDEYQMYDGRWSDGNRIKYNLDGFRLGDTVIAKLISMDEPMYDYFWTLQAAIATDSGGQSGWVPANPNSNLSNGALGYFGAFSVGPFIIVI